MTFLDCVINTRGIAMDEKKLTANEDLACTVCCERAIADFWVLQIFIATLSISFH